MSTVFVLFFLASLGLLTWGLIAPKSLAKHANKATKKELTRKHFAVFFGLAAFMMLILAGMTAPTPAAPNPQTPKPTPVTKAPVVEKKTETETQPVPFASTTVNDATLSKSTTKVTTAGVNGIKTITFEVTYTDGKQTDKKQVKEEITTQPVTQVTNVGTYVAPATQKPSNSCNPNYSGCVPNVSYDLDCPDIGHRVTVIGTDVYRLDADHDGIGCDSY